MRDKDINAFKGCPFIFFNLSISENTIELLDMDMVKSLSCKCDFQRVKDFFINGKDLTQKLCRESHIMPLEIAKACVETKRDAEKTLGKLGENK